VEGGGLANFTHIGWDICSRTFRSSLKASGREDRGVSLNSEAEYLTLTKGNQRLKVPMVTKRAHLCALPMQNKTETSAFEMSLFLCF